jgi:hypothetical protein
MGTRRRFARKKTKKRRGGAHFGAIAAHAHRQKTAPCATPEQIQKRNEAFKKEIAADVESILQTVAKFTGPAATSTAHQKASGTF